LLPLLGIFIHIHAKKWTIEKGMKLWLEKSMVKEPAPRRSPEKSAHLVCDHFRSHVMEAIKKCG
jgi:hypothetical protein